MLLISEEFGYSVADIRQLRDDHPHRMPTKKNISAAIHWLVKDARSGDHLFLHYSGHGTQVKDEDGDEADGKDEALVPCDYQTAGFIVDDDLRRARSVGGRGSSAWRVAGGAWVARVVSTASAGPW